MSQQQFNRPGAFDLSGLARPQAGAGAGAPPDPLRGAGGRRTPSPSPQENLQSLLESSTTAPVLLVFYSRSRMPESGQLADDIATLSAEFDGRFLAGLVDIDAVPAIAQAMQIPTVPLVVVVLDGRPMPLLQDVVPLDELRDRPDPGAAAVHRAGHHRAGTSRFRWRAAEQRTGEPVASTPGTPRPRTRSPPVTWPARSRSTRSSWTPTPPTSRPPPDWRWPRCCSARRVSTRPPPGPRRPPTPTTSTPTPWWPTSTWSAGTSRTPSPGWSTLVRRTAGDDRDRARQHLLGLFAAVGNEDPRVLQGPAEPRVRPVLSRVGGRRSAQVEAARPACSAERAASSRATGTRNGEQDT